MGTTSELDVSIDKLRRTATLTIHRAKKLGSLSKTVFQELLRALDDLGKDTNISCIILASDGRAFSAGNAIVGGEAPPDSLARETIAAIEACPVPVVVAVQGFAYTGALELIVAADIVLAGESAYFQDTHAKLGLVPTWGGNVRLPRRIGLQRSNDLMFTCRKVTAQEALAWGLVSRVVADSDLLAEANVIADSIAMNSRDSIAKQKRVMMEAARRPLGDALEWNVREHPGHAIDVKERIGALQGKAKGMPTPENNSQDIRRSKL